MASWYDVVHLDRMMIVPSGTYDGGPEETTFTLPSNDETLDTCVLGPAFALFGGILPLVSNTSGSVVVGGDYSAGEVVIGRAFTMSCQLTRPYVRDADQNADFDARLTLREITAALHRTGKCVIRLTQPGRPEQRNTVDIDPIVLRNTVKARDVGNAEEVQVFIENDSPKPAIITSLEWIVDYASRES